MNIIYSDMKIPDIIDTNTIFLAGPTPRLPYVKSWRLEAIEIFKELKFQGTLFIPERKDWSIDFSYDDQVEWEYTALHCSKVIMFWIPRYLPDMPGFTTNVEFGYWLAKYPEINNVIYGRPNDSEKNRYLDWMYKKETSNDIENTLIGTIRQTIGVLYG